MMDLRHWTAWLNRHGPALVLAARQWTGGHADAEDVVQEALVRFWPHRDRARDPLAMLYVGVKRAALQWHRQNTRRKKRDEAKAALLFDESHFAPAESSERRQIVESALNQLPDVQREVLIMKIWLEMSFPQIAAVLQISADTAASRYRYAKEKLRILLKEEVI